MSRIVSGYVGGLPGVHAMFAGTNWEWHQVIKVNDRIRSKSYLKDLVEKRSEFSGRAIQQIYETSFENQESEVVAKANSWCFRTERDTARTRDKYGSIKPHRYSIEELRTIAADYRREKVRGTEPRYWEDVRVGEELTPVVKGPLTATSVIAFLQGWGGLYIRAHGLAFELYEKHPALGIPNSQGVPEPPERVHWSSEFAKRVGVPMAYDYGPERVSWLGHLMTNWMGDDGVLRKLEVQVRRFNILGDTTWCRGEVVEKYFDGDNYLVKCKIWAENQTGAVTAKGTATVMLTSKK